MKKNKFKQIEYSSKELLVIAMDQTCAEFSNRDRTRASTLRFFILIFFYILTCKKPADYGPQQH